VKASALNLRRLTAEEMRALSDVLASGSDTAIAHHLATILDDPAIALLKHAELVHLVDELTCLTFAGSAEPRAR
jgi:hypothetical protein